MSKQSVKSDPLLEGHRKDDCCIIGPSAKGIAEGHAQFHQVGARSHQLGHQFQSGLLVGEAPRSRRRRDPSSAVAEALQISAVSGPFSFNALPNSHQKIHSGKCISHLNSLSRPHRRPQPRPERSARRGPTRRAKGSLCVCRDQARSSPVTKDRNKHTDRSRWNRLNTAALTTAARQHSQSMAPTRQRRTPERRPPPPQGSPQPTPGK